MQPISNSFAPDPTAAPASPRDPYLWAKARGRAKFKSHLLVFGLVNAGLWALWALTGFEGLGRRGAAGVPWPAYTTLFWGIGLAANFVAVYLGFGRSQQTQREYERLLRQQQGQSAATIPPGCMADERRGRAARVQPRPAAGS